MSLPAKRGTSQGWIPSIFNDFFSNEWLMRNNATAPAINVFECEKRYTVEVAAPGMTKDDFAINLNSENNLTISMEKNCSCKEGKCCDDKTDNKEKEDNQNETGEEHKGRYLRREFSYTKFQQTLIMPENADTAKIEAKVKHGVLHIQIPKKSISPEDKVARIIKIE